MMRLLPILPTLALALGCGTLQDARADDPLDALQRRVIEVSERVTPSVVHIEAAVRVNNRGNLVTGSGFVMDPTGVVLTNEHVVERAQKVSVIVPGRRGRYRADVVGTDKQTDLAVLRIEPRPNEPPFAVAELGDSEVVNVGEWVVAIGNPYGLDGTVSLGIISAKGRDLRAENLLNDFLQTDAMIDRGSSGGPLVNLSAQVIGINSRGQGRGIGFTIPINTAKRVAADLLGAGQIARGYLGVSVQPLSRELAEYWEIDEVHGIVVNGVSPGTPAADAGLRVGDIVTAFDGEAVQAEKDEDIGDFQRRVALTPVGQDVVMEVMRGDRTLELSTRLGRQPKVVPDEEETDFGFTVQEVTENLYRSHRLTDRKGVLVSFVERGSEAAEAGMAPGDVIRRIRDDQVDDIGAFRTSMRDLDGNPFLVHATRGADTRFLLIIPRGDHHAETPQEEGPTGD